MEETQAEQSKQTTVMFEIDTKLLEKIEAFANQNNLTIQEVFVKASEEYLREYI